MHGNVECWILDVECIKFRSLHGIIPSSQVKPEDCPALAGQFHQSKTDFTGFPILFHTAPSVFHSFIATCGGSEMRFTAWNYLFDSEIGLRPVKLPPLQVFTTVPSWRDNFTSRRLISLDDNPISHGLCPYFTSIYSFSLYIPLCIC